MSKSTDFTNHLNKVAKEVSAWPEWKKSVMALGDERISTSAKSTDNAKPLHKKIRTK